MKKKNKLVLDRETVAVLQSDALDAVHGGNATGCMLPPTRGIMCGSGSGVTSQLVSCGSQISRQVSEQVSRQISRTSFGGDR